MMNTKPMKTLRCRYAAEFYTLRFISSVHNMNNLEASGLDLIQYHLHEYIFIYTHVKEY